MLLPFVLSLSALVALPGLPADPQDPAPGDPPPGRPPGPPRKRRQDPPREPGLKVLDEEAIAEGYNLVTPLGARDVVLFDSRGKALHTWPTELAPGGPVYLLDDGSILRPGRVDSNEHFNGGGIGGRLERIAWDGEVIWSFDLADEARTQHHDLAVLPSGNVLAIVWEAHTPEEAVARGRDPEALSERGLWSCGVYEIRPVLPDGGEIVWRWSSWDHLIQDRDDSLPGYGSVPDHPGRIDINGDHRDQPPMTVEEAERLAELERKMRALGYIGGDDDEEEDDEGARRRRERGRRPDWLHTNSVAHQAEYDLVALSSPHMSELWVIDHSTTTEEAAGSIGGRWGRGGELLWRWGNPRNYGHGDDSDKRLFYQHDPEWVDGPDGALHLLVYNNGGGRPGGDHSTVEELALPFSGERGFEREEGEPFGPRDLHWSHGEPGGFFSPFISGAQRLPNGNTLICVGAPGRLIEVSSEGRVVWDYVNEHVGRPVPKSDVAPSTPPGALFRALRIPADHPGLAGRELAAGE